MLTKAIKDFNNTTPVDGDAFLIQRDQNYYYVNAEDLGGGLFKARVTLTVLELEALNVTPIEVIAAQGANTYIQIVAATAFRNGAAYTAPDAVFKLVFTGQTQAYYKSMAAYLTTVGATLTTQLALDTTGLIAYANTGISAYLTQDVTTATGTLTVEIIYRVATFS